MKSSEEILVEKLILYGKKVAAAESCTGGLIAQKITSVPGSSACFDLGVVTYANEQKEKILGVDKATLDKCGAVSPEVALQMSKGLKEISGADFAISVTGLAGPGGATPKKPVGLVYISICTDSDHEVFENHFSGSRDEVREKTAERALNFVIDRI